MNYFIRTNLLCSLFILITSILTIGCQQEAVIKGKVIDNFKQPLKGVTVSIEGMDLKATTNESGDYSIKYLPGKIKLKYNLTGYKTGILELDLATKDEVPAKTIALKKYPPESICLKGKKDYVKLEPTVIKKVTGTKGNVAWELFGNLNVSPVPLFINAESPRTNYIIYELPLNSSLPLKLPIKKDIFGVVLNTDKVNTGFFKDKGGFVSIGGPPGEFYVLIIPVDRRLDGLIVPDMRHPAYVATYQSDESLKAKLEETYANAIKTREKQLVEAEEARKRAIEEKKLAREKAIRDRADIERAKKLNNKAWRMATSKNPSARNGEKAVKYAKEAVSIVDRIGKYPFPRAYFYGTLAAALAENGQFEDAVNKMLLAIKFCKQSQQCTSKQGERMQKRLSYYKNGKPWRE